MVTSGNWLVPSRPSFEARHRLFCLPYAGGGASLFHPWRAQMPAGVEATAVQLPGRENRLREPPFTDVRALVDAMGPRLRPYFDRPYSLLGYSFGALLAFELARWLRRQGERPPDHLFVAARRAPHLADDGPAVHRYTDSELVEWLRKLGGTPDLLLEHPELLPLYLPILRADLAAHETYLYQPEEPLALPITAFGGLGDTQASPAEFEAWREQTSSTWSAHFYAGGHFFLKEHQQAFLRDLAGKL
jgi:medium-chain acyl-[acyl-carrier-protein] hydrolase